MTEGMMAHVFQTTMGVQLETPFPRIAYDDAMDWYGSDKPELRFDMKMQDAAFMAEIGTFQAFKDALAPNEKGQVAGAVKALVVPGVAADYSRKKIEELEGTAKIYKARGLGWTKVAGSEAEPALEGGIAKFFEGKAAEICSPLGAKPGDLLLFVADQKKSVACTALGAVRSRLGKDLNLCDPDQFAFAWIVDFPMFEWNQEENKWDPAHHMFTMPQEKYHATLESDPASVKGDLYDLVLNGYELASGSIRIHDPQLQKRIFQIVGFDEAEGQKKFGFLTEAFKYGAPPHGGIAPGLDRLVMLMCKETSIKEVIAFPKNTFAQSPMDDCPSRTELEPEWGGDGIHILPGCVVVAKAPYLQYASAVALRSMGFRCTALEGNGCCIRPAQFMYMSEEEKTCYKRDMIAKASGNEVLALCHGCSEEMNASSLDVRNLIQFLHGNRDRLPRLSKPLSVAVEPGCQAKDLFGEMKEVVESMGCTVTNTTAGCCGKDTRVSSALLRERLEECSGSDVIVAGCPKCFTKYDAYPEGMPVMFLTELVAMAVGDVSSLKYHRIPFSGSNRIAPP